MTMTDRWRRLRCFLAFHKFEAAQTILGFEVVTCAHCNRRWAVNHDTNGVHELEARS
jgi:hypothetical protein